VQEHIAGGIADAVLCDLMPMLRALLRALPRGGAGARAGGMCDASVERLHLSSLRLLSTLWAAVSADAAEAPLLAPVQLTAAVLAVCTGLLPTELGGGCLDEEAGFRFPFNAGGAVCLVCGQPTRARDGGGGSALHALWAAFAHACLTSLASGHVLALAGGASHPIVRFVIHTAPQRLLLPPSDGGSTGAACRCAAMCAAARAHVAQQAPAGCSVAAAAGSAYPWLAPLLLRGCTRPAVLAGWLQRPAGGGLPLLAALRPRRAALHQLAAAAGGARGGVGEVAAVVASQLDWVERLLAASASGAAAVAAAATAT